MQDRRPDTPLCQHPFHPAELLHLPIRHSLIPGIRFGKMRKHSLYYNMRHCRNLCDFICSFLAYLKTQTAQSCVNLDVDGNLASRFPGRLLQCLCLAQGEHRCTDSLLCQRFVTFRKGRTQHQNGLFHPIPAQDLCFLRRCRGIPPDNIKLLQLPPNRHCPMAVAVCLNHPHNFCATADILLHLFHIVDDGIQIYLCIDPAICFHFKTSFLSGLAVSGQNPAHLPSRAQSPLKYPVPSAHSVPGLQPAHPRQAHGDILP